MWHCVDCGEEFEYPASEIDDSSGIEFGICPICGSDDVWDYADEDNN